MSDRNSPGADSPTECTLRLSKDQAALLRAQLEADEKGAPTSRRSHKRFTFDKHPVRVVMTHPGGMQTSLLYLCRNISKGGCSILHSAYVYIDTSCRLTIPQRNGTELEVLGVVRNCRHVSGKVHEIGIQFNEPIDIRSIPGLELSDSEQGGSPIDPASLRGRALLVEDCPMMRAISVKFLEKSGLDIEVAENAHDALNALKEQYDLILCDLDLPDGNAAQIHHHLRGEGRMEPFILLSAHNQSTVRQAFGEDQPDAFLPKPFGQEGLFGVLHEFLVENTARRQDPTRSSLSEDSPVASQIGVFVEQAHQLAEALERCIEKDNYEAARRIVGQIQGAAPTFGFEPVGAIAAGAQKQLTASMSPKESSSSLSSLVRACRNIKNEFANAA